MKKNISGSEALKIIVEAAKNYDIKLNDKHFLIVYQEGSQIKTSCVGFRYGKKADMPVTLYNENVKTLSRPVYKVLAIFAKEYNESMYRTCTYLVKEQELEKLRLPEKVAQIGVDAS
ncbi:MAG: hypothetical protein IJZ23_00145 [Roseburia sp.]|nr:hypothetical protein [Roseburia sp.]